MEGVLILTVCLQALVGLFWLRSISEEILRLYGLLQFAALKIEDLEKRLKEVSDGKEFQS